MDALWEEQRKKRKDCESNGFATKRNLPESLIREDIYMITSQSLLVGQ